MAIQHSPCNRHGLRYEKHGNQNGIEHVFRKIRRRTSSLPNCFSNAEAETGDDRFRSFTFAWNHTVGCNSVNGPLQKTVRQARDAGNSNERSSGKYSRQYQLN